MKQKTDYYNNPTCPPLPTFHTKIPMVTINNHIQHQKFHLPPPHHSLPCHVSVTLLCISWPMTREQQREAGGPRIGRRNPDGWGLTVTPSSLMFWRQHPGSASWQGLLDCKSCRIPAQCLTSPSLGLIFQFPFPNTNL